jgi:hypothetical protein
MTKVIILDPGLSELGGHHAATVAALNSQFNTDTTWQFEVWAHKSCDETVFETLNNGTTKLVRHFTTPFYRYFKQELALSELQDYLLPLALEYGSALELSTRDIGEQDVLFWCHTLDWQHAYALSLALSMRQQKASKREQIKVFVGLMYRQSSHEYPHFHSDVLVPFCYQQLANHSGVTFYAADSEIQHDYEQMLARPVGIQPCLLLGHSGVPSTNWQDKPASIILFAGDAKPNKGFTELPELAEQWIKQRPDIEFVVQYTINNGNPILLETESRLFELQGQFSNLKIHNYFVDHQALQQLFQQARGIVFNYYEADYQQQSSGLLWLAVYYQLNVLCLTNTWQQREAKRLDYTVVELSEQQIDNTVWSQLVSAPISQELAITRNDYFQSLFTDIPTWLKLQWQDTNNAEQR